MSEAIKGWYSQESSVNDKRQRDRETNRDTEKSWPEPSHGRTSRTASDIRVNIIDY